MHLTAMGANQAEIKFGDTVVFFSYSTPVAYRDSEGREFFTQTRYSTTTSKHINSWLRSRASATPVHQSVIDAQVKL